MTYFCFRPVSPPFSCISVLPLSSGSTPCRQSRTRKGSNSWWRRSPVARRQKRSNAPSYVIIYSLTQDNYTSLHNSLLLTIQFITHCSDPYICNMCFLLVYTFCLCPSCFYSTCTQFSLGHLEYIQTF